MALVALATCAAQAQRPVQFQGTIAIGATSVDIAVPAGVEGALWTIQPRNMTNASTLKVEHLIPFTGGTFTNTIETAAAADTLLTYPTEYVPALTYGGYASTNITSVTFPSPRPLERGDTLRFTVSAANGSATYVTVRASVPNR